MKIFITGHSGQRYKMICLGLVIFMVFGLFPSKSQAQSMGGFGLKAGLNYNANGNYFKDAQLILDNPLSNLGFHAGGFAKLDFGLLYVRPELIYSQLKSTVQNEEFLTKRLDAPVLLGTGFLGSLISVFAGPSFHYRLRDDLLGSKFTDIAQNFNTGYQLGLGVNLGPIGLDLRYEKELKGRELSLNNVMAVNDDFKFRQIILGLSVKF
jgi:opacity protein-like surface antigen